MKPTFSQNFIAAISDIRQRDPGQIIPVSAEQSSTLDDNDELYPAAHAIDFDFDTKSKTKVGKEQWLEMKLDKVYCIERVEQYNSPSSNPYNEWKCSDSDCSRCAGPCSTYLLTVSIEDPDASGSLPDTDCKQGDTVKLQLNEGSIIASEISIIVRQGEIKYRQIS